MIGRLTTSLAHLRPRVLAKTQKVVADLVAETDELKQRFAERHEEAEARSAERAKEARQHLKQLDGALKSAARLFSDRYHAAEAKADQRAEEMRGHVAAIERQLADINKTVAALALRESQLRAIAEADVVLEGEYEALGAILNERRIADHVGSALRCAELRLDPFPHAVVQDLFPADFYNALVRGIPPVELFEDGRINKQQLLVPFALAPAYSRRVWQFMADVVAQQTVAPAMIEKFKAPLAEWIRLHWPALGDDPFAPPMEMRGSDGRVMLRRRGYNIPPHRDPKWGFLTCLVYLPRPGDLESWGTQLYRVDADDEARGALPHWIKAERCHLAVDVPFRRNTALMFLNSTGAHAATIPMDAEPADLQRYAYQFRVGPTRNAVAALMERLPDDRRAAWAGKVTDY